MLKTQKPDKEGTRLVCAHCNGNPKTTALCFVNTGEDYTEHYSEVREMVCHVCEGRGWNYPKRQIAYLEARRQRKHRVKNLESLSDAAKRLGMKVTDLSAYEHGKVLPPNERD